MLDAESELAPFVFLGKLFGMSIRVKNKYKLPLKLPPFFWLRLAK
jgi:hypothetical protein